MAQPQHEAQPSLVRRFCPLENPEVAIAVLIEGIIPQDKIQGGLTATPVARDILQAYFDLTRKNLPTMTQG